MKLWSWSKTSMNTSNSTITVSDIPVEIVRKDIKNIHLSVHPPEGRVRISVPEHVTDENIRLAIVSRLSWIRKQQEQLHKQPRQTEREYVSGESHYYQGKRYLLEVLEQHGRHSLELKNNAKMRLRVSPGTSRQNRARVMNDWYRDQLKQQIPGLLEKWQPIVDKEVKEWGIKRMRTKWGSCNISEARIWLNLELAKKSPECLEYILVHELVHLHQRKHDDSFRRLMDKYLSSWRQRRDILRREPLAHEDWEY
jgi:predicted metal-dependent hydrolase